MYVQYLYKLMVTCIVDYVMEQYFLSIYLKLCNFIYIFLLIYKAYILETMQVFCIYVDQ